jgi:hypothetical protein
MSRDDRKDDMETERVLQRFIEDRKQAAKPGPDFTLKVMDAVRHWDAAHKTDGATPASASSRRSREAGDGWMVRLRALFDALAAPGPRMALASLALMAVAGTAWYSLDRGKGPGLDETRIKGGGFLLGFQLLREGRVDAAVPGAEFRAGDRLQAVYSAEAPGHLQLFSVDAAGSISCFSCAAPDTLLPAGRLRALSYALELDASVGAEGMVAFWSPGPAEAGARLDLLRAAWKEAGPDTDRLSRLLAARVPKGTAVSVFPLLKQGGTR